MVYAESILSIDKEEAQKHLELLGYKHEDKIFMRYIHANPAEGQPKSIKKSRLNWEECERYQSQGYDAYFVINGGGDTDAAVKVGRAIFYEHDDLPKNIQRELWHNLGLPEPTVQIDTGGKSVHSYWVFHQPIGIKDWRELQEDLLDFADGDRSIKNPSRILRLAGCRYMKGDNPGSNIATIITASGKRYSYLELRDVIQVQKAQVTGPLDSIELPVSESVPLELCLTKRSREMLASGTTAPDKQRNDSGIELARDLIGTTAYLKKIGQAYDGNPEILFFDWCRAVALDTDKPKGQPEGIWKSASKDNPSPGSGEDGVQACIKGWHWRENIKTAGRNFSGSIGSVGGRGGNGGSRGSGGDGGDGNATYQKLSIREAIAKAEQILKARFSSQLDSIEASILLEELRREASVNEYNWEQKYLKPLREKLERSLALPVVANQPTAQTDPSQQLRLELLALIKETDPIKKVRKRAEIASHYGISKGEIEFLCRTLDSDSKTPKAQFFDLDDFLNMESDGIDYLIPGLLPRGETVLCTGLPKSGKTLLAIDAGFAIATGESNFLGEAVQQGRVLLISVDESTQSTKAKLLKRGFRPRDAANIAVMTAWDISQLDALEAKLEDFRPDLVIIDSLKRITAGREISENSAEFADVLYTLKELIGRYGAASILIHHSNKNQDATGVSRVRGSTAIVGAVWGIWQMDIPESEDESDRKPSKGKLKQKRFDPTNPNRIFTAICRDTEGALLNIRFNPENHSYGISESDESAQSDRKTQEQIILQILAQFAPRGLTGREIMDYSKLGRGVYSVLNRMIEKRLITQRQSTTDARMTVYCLPKSKTPPPPSQSHPICDQYSSNPNIGNDLEIDHKLITSHKKIDHNIEGDRPCVINSNSQPEPPLVEIDHKNTNKGGEGVSSNPVVKLNSKSITYKQCSDIADPWEEEYTIVNADADVLGEVVRIPSQVATTPVENAPQAAETVADEETPQDNTAKPAYEMVAVPDEEWQIGDHIFVDASDLPSSLQGYDGRRGIVDQIKKVSEQCLIDFGDDDFMHIPFRGLRRG